MNMTIKEFLKYSWILLTSFIRGIALGGGFAYFLYFFLLKQQIYIGTFAFQDKYGVGEYSTEITNLPKNLRDRDELNANIEKNIRMIQIKKFGHESVVTSSTFLLGTYSLDR